MISSQISAYTTADYAADPGRTWISDSDTRAFESIRILGKAHLALHPDLKEYVFNVSITFLEYKEETYYQVFKW